VVVWGDVDNDGWPDLLLGGNMRVGAGNTNITRIYRNAGDGSFTEFASFGPWNVSQAFWADLDSDGLLDVVLYGMVIFPGGLSERVTKVYLNRGAGQFLDISPTLPSNFSEPSSAAIGDLDRDGKIDLVLAPYFLHNNFPSANSPPQPPSGMNAQPLTNTVTLSWLPVTDANQAGGLSYNLRVGTASGLSDIMSPLADIATGRRWTPAPGNASESVEWHLRSLQPGVYFWSVQAIDNSYASSPFAPEQTFTIADPRPKTLSIALTNNQIALDVEFGWAGSYSLLTSSNLQEWTEFSPLNYSAGHTNVLVPASGHAAQFLRWRRN